MGTILEDYTRARALSAEADRLLASVMTRSGFAPWELARIRDRGLVDMGPGPHIGTDDGGETF